MAGSSGSVLVSKPEFQKSLTRLSGALTAGSSASPRGESWIRSIEVVFVVQAAFRGHHVGRESDVERHFPVSVRARRIPG